jgi:hypothetical protein
VTPLLDRFAAFWAGLPPNIQQTVIAVLAVAAAIGPLLVIIGSLIKTVGSILSFGSTAIGLIETIVGALSGPVLLIIAAVVAAVAGLYLAWKNNLGGIQEIAGAAWEAIKSIFADAVAFIKAILAALQEFWRLWGASIVAVLEPIFAAVKNIILAALNVIKNLFSIITGILTGDWSKAWNAFIDIVQNVPGYLLKALGNILLAIAQFLALLLQAALELGWAIIKGIVQGVVAGLKWIVNLGVQIVAAIWEGAKSLVSWITNNFLDFFANLPSKLWEAAKGVGKAIVSAIWEGIKSLWNWLTGGIDSLVQNALAQAKAKAAEQAGAPAGTPATPQQAAAILPGLRLLQGGQTAAATPPTAPERPNNFGSPGGAGGGKKGRTVREPVAPLDRAERADEERRLAQTKDANDRLLKENQRSYDAQIISFSEFLGRRIQLNQANIDLEISSRREAGNRIIAEINDLNSRLAHSKGAEANAVKKELDEKQGELIKVDNEITILRRSRADIIAEAEAETAARLRETARAAEEARQRYFELTGEKRKAARIGIGLEFDEKQVGQARDLAAAQKALEAARGSGDADTIAAARSEVKRLETEIRRTEQIRQQLELQTDFAKIQTDLEEIERVRGLNLEALNRELARTGATEDEATKARRDLMQRYQIQIDKVVESLRGLQQAGLISPELQKLLDTLASNKAETGLIPLDERAGEAQKAFDRLMRARSDALDLNDERTASALDKERERLRIVADYNAKLVEQLAIWRQIESQRTGGVSDQFKDAEKQVQQTTEKVINFKVALKDTAAAAAVSGIVNFFQDLATGAKGLKDAALDALGAFIRTIQQIIVQILALKLIELVTGIPVGTLLKISGGGLRDGGAASSLPVGRFADGGASAGGEDARIGRLRVNPVGYVRGAGSPRSDSIPVYFPAARRMGRLSDTEYIFDAETTRNVGLERLEAIRRAKGKNFDAQFFGRVTGYRADYRFAEGGAASGALSAVAGIPEIAGGDTNIDLQQLNVIDKRPIEEIISDHALSSKGDRLFVNQMTRNLSTIRAKLGIKG